MEHRRLLTGFGGLEHNALALVRQLVEARVFRPGAGVRGAPPVWLLVVFSDQQGSFPKGSVTEKNTRKSPDKRHDRTVQGSATLAALEACVALPRCFEDSPYAVVVDHHRPYGSTMHALWCRIQACKRLF